tara:strand:- start:7353 stop:7955 length:603 start_codon:yes stop_codon:yes gene_type:complete
MKIYFDGCSWTEGAELENPEEERYSKLLCNELGAEEYNIAMSGGSNDRIVRNLLVENNIEDYDMAVIQMTFPVRTEFYNNKWKRDRWIRINPCYNYSKRLNGEDGNIERLGEKFKDHSDFWKYYYLQITNEKYFETKEKIHYHTIRNSCKIPLVLVTINRWTKLPFDLQMNDGTRLMKHKMGHPNKHLHKEYADKILKML